MVKTGHIVLKYKIGCFFVTSNILKKVYQHKISYFQQYVGKQKEILDLLLTFKGSVQTKYYHPKIRKANSKFLRNRDEKAYRGTFDLVIKILFG